MKKKIKRLLRPLKQRLTKVSMARPYELRLISPGEEFSGQVAVITGGSGAIGRAIALRLASGGAEVYAIGRNQNVLDELKQEVAALGGTCHPVLLDVTDRSAVDDFFESLARVDILVNCAGGSSRDESRMIWEQTGEVIDRVLDVNLRGAMACTGAAARRMVEQRSGRIVAIGSVIGERGKARFSEYAASKAAIVGYMKSAAIEVGAYGVTANVVSPGIVPRGTPTVEELEAIKRTNVLGRVGHEEDIAEAVAFIAGPRAGFITGQDLAVDGGRSLGLRGDA